MKTNFNILRLIILLCLCAISCAPPAPPISDCNTNNTPFQQLYNSLTSIPDYTDVISFDTEIHEYTFVMDYNGEICSFGYQSQATTMRFPYTIELLDESNRIIFSHNFKFSAANTLYAYVDPITIIAGQTYTIRRIILLKNVNNEFENLTGRAVVKTGSLVSFPIKVGNMTITHSCFYQNGNTLTNAGIPYIDFGFN